MIFEFGRDLRLLKASEFKRVFDKAEIKVSDKNLLILARRNTNGTPRLGLIIAKKNIRTAVARNKVKRIMRETFRLSQNSLPELDYIVLARKGLGELDNRQLQSLLDKQWLRVKKRLGQSDMSQKRPSTSTPAKARTPVD